MPDSSLSPEDLKLLMGNFQNIIQMNTILVEQQKNLITAQNRILEKQDQITTKQNSTCNQLSKIADKLDECANNLKLTNDSIQNSCASIDTHISTKLDDTSKNVEAWKLDVVKQHSSINKNVYIAWGGMVTVILGLIGLLISAYERSGVITQIHETLQQLAQYFHLG